MKKLIFTLIVALGIVTGAQASGGEEVAWDKAPNKVNELPALQNGAKLFVNYCLNCHSAAFMRYNRLRDIGLTEQQIKDNLLFTTDKVGDTMKAAIDPRQAKDWFELEGEIRLNEGLAIDLQQLVKLAGEGHGRFIPLGEGEYLALSAQLKKRLEELASFADPHGKAFRFHPLAAGVFRDFADEVRQVELLAALGHHARLEQVGAAERMHLDIDLRREAATAQQQAHFALAQAVAQMGRQ